MGVTLSEKAASEVKKIITEQNLPDGTVLRVGVQGAVAAASLTAWVSIPRHRARPDHRRPRRQAGGRQEVRPLPRRTVVDFYDGLEKRGFVFNNPNVVKSCGCGSSFQV